MVVCSTVAGCRRFVVIYELGCSFIIVSIIGERLIVVQRGISLPSFSCFFLLFLGAHWDLLVSCSLTEWVSGASFFGYAFGLRIYSE